MIRRFLFAVLVCMVVTPSSYAVAATITEPLQTVTVAQKGIDTSDYDLFNQAVDVDGLINNSLDTALKGLKTSMENGRLEGANPVLMLTLGSLDFNDPIKLAMIKGLLASETRNMISAGIRGGYFAGKPNGKVNKQQSALLEGLSDKRKELIPGKVISQSGSQAVITATLKDADAGNIPLELGVDKVQGSWRITHVRNAAKIVDETIKNNK